MISTEIALHHEHEAAYMMAEQMARAWQIKNGSFRVYTQWWGDTERIICETKDQKLVITMIEKACAGCGETLYGFRLELGDK